MRTWRFAPAVLSCVEVVAPLVVYKTAPELPSHKSVQFVVAALRGLFPTSVSAVVVFTVPLVCTMPTTQLTSIGFVSGKGVEPPRLLA